MDIFILIAVIGYFLYKIVAPKSSNQSSKGDGLTDTQRNFRQQMALTTDGKTLDPFKNGLSEQERLILEISKYIRENMKPFNFLEWLGWAISPKLLVYYLVTMLVVMSAWIIMPLVIGLPLLPALTVMVLIMTDLMLYRRERLYSVTKWDPEFIKKYGRFLSDLH